MVRKTGGSKKSLSKSMFDVDFEVVLIIVLIVVAIVLVCFINRKFNKESFISSAVREHMRNGRGHSHHASHGHNHGHGHEHFSEGENGASNGNGNGNENSSRHLYLFYATWCGHSRRFLENELPELEAQLDEQNLRDNFHSVDVETPDGRTQANSAGVTGLPSVYRFENGVFTKVSNNDHVGNVQWLSGAN